MSETAQAGAGAVEAHVLLLLGAAGGAPVPTAEHLHKMAYHLSAWLPDLKAAARFEASEAGPRSPEVGGAAARLGAAGLLDRGPGGYTLTAAGRARLDGRSPEGGGAARAADSVKSGLNCMTRDEVLAMSHFTHDRRVPCTRSGPEHERLSGIRRELADGMHRGKKLGILMAACIAGVPAAEYIRAARGRGWVSDLYGPP